VAPSPGNPGRVRAGSGPGARPPRAPRPSPRRGVRAASPAGGPPGCHARWRCCLIATHSSSTRSSRRRGRPMTDDVLVERLIVEGDGDAASVDFHPRLTVLGGMPPDARAALASLLSGALHGTVRGVHLEVVDDTGRRLVVLRPTSGPHRVIDVATASDVTAQHRGFDGRVDLLSSQYGRSTVTCITAADLRSRTPRNDAVRALSAVDQVALWSAADELLGHGGGSRGDVAATWRELAGDTDVHWAADHRTEIQAAARLRQHIAAL